MQMTSYLPGYTGLTLAQLFGPPALVTITQDGTGKIDFSLWNVPNVAKPTDAQIAAALAAPEPITMLVAELIAAASTKCAAVSALVITDDTHRDGYMTAAQIVGPGATVPTTDPTMSAFNALASAFGMQPQPFATLVTNVAAIAMELSATLTTATTAARNAKTPGDLNNVLVAFEKQIATIIAAIQAAGLPVVAPPKLSIVGINA